MPHYKCINTERRNRYDRIGTNGKRAKEAARELAFAGDKKNQGLAAIAKALREHKDNIIKANALDIEAAKQNGMSESLLDRLTLTSERIEGMAKGVEEVLALKDPIGTVLDGMVQSNGLKIEKYVYLWVLSA